MIWLMELPQRGFSIDSGIMWKNFHRWSWTIEMVTEGHFDLDRKV